MAVNDDQLWEEFEAKLAEQGTTVVGLKGASEDAFLQILAGFEYNFLTQRRLITMINTVEECKKNELIPCPAHLKKSKKRARGYGQLSPKNLEGPQFKNPKVCPVNLCDVNCVCSSFVFLFSTKLSSIYLIHTYVCRKRCSSRLWILQAWIKISQSFAFPSITSINTERLLP